jgi:hypothetical protein
VNPNQLQWEIIANNNVYTAQGTDTITVDLLRFRTYDVSISVFDAGGCSNSNSKSLVLKGTYIRPILSYQNPVQSNSSFVLKKDSNEQSFSNSTYTIEIWNEYSLVRSEKYDDAPEFIVSTDGLAPGVYFIRIYQNGEFLNTQKVIIE